MSLILVIDSLGDQAPWINQVLRRAGHEVILSNELPSGSLVGLLRPAAVIVNLVGEPKPNPRSLEIIRRYYPYSSIIALVADPSYETAVVCMRAGAADCLMAPLEGTEVVAAVDRAMSRNFVPGGGYRAVGNEALTSDERYKILAEISNEGIWALDKTDGTIFINNMMCEMLGYSPDEILGRRAIDFMPPEEAEDQRKRIENRIGGKIDRYERCFMRKDGSRAYFIISASPLYDRENRFSGSIAICTDITARKQVENELITKEAKFRTVVEQLSEGFLLVDENGLIIEWNTAQEKITGIPAADAIGKLYSDIFLRLLLPEFRTPARMANLHKVIERGLKGGRSYFFGRPIDISIQAGDGTHRFMEQTIFPIQTGEGFRVAAITRDVTQNKKFMIEIQESEERYRSVVETSPDGIMIMDLNGIMLSCNRRTAEMVGFAHPDELKNTQALDLIVPPERERAVHILKSVFKEGGVRDVEFTAMRKNGDIFIAEISANAVRDALGQPRFLMGIARDVTSRKQTEGEMRRLNRALRATSACNQALVRAVDEMELLNEICRTVVLEGGYHFAWVALIAEIDKPPAPVAWYRKQDKRLSLSLCQAENSDPGAPLAQAVATLHPVAVDNTLYTAYGEDWKTVMRDSGMRSMAALPLHYEGQVFGALLIYSRETWAFDDHEMILLNEMAADLSYGIHTLQVRADRLMTYDLLNQSKTDLETAYDATLEGWSRALELRERETAGHSKRVVQMTVDLADALGICQDNCVHLRRGALLHDIGKMGIPDSILLKPGMLTEDEWVVMRNHPGYAYQLLQNIPYLQPSLEIPYYHHERWDGSGYPNGLKGDQIPLAARIFAVVDVWDALTSSRPYRPAWPEQQTLDYIRSQSGISFDPQVVDAFLKLDLSQYRV